MTCENNMKRRRISQVIKPSSFFKLMLSPSSQSTKLRIPVKFARAYYGELYTSKNAIFTVPTGEKWEVSIVKRDDKIWFVEGWNKFVDNYSIEYGYFLLFKYEGNLKFNVHIYDLSTCEISYENEQHCHQGLGLEQINDSVSDGRDDFSDDDSVSVSGSDADSDFECLGSPSNSHVIELNDDDDRVSGDEDREMKSNDERKSGHSSETITARQTTSVTSLPDRFKPREDLMKAVTVAGIPIPENPFFVSLIKPYNLYQTRYINVPIPFARKFLGIEAKCFQLITLEVDDGRQWEVKCIKSGKKSTFGKGWITFANDYGLEVGDVCVHEITDSNRFVLKVRVAKNSVIQAAGLDLLSSKL